MRGLLLSVILMDIGLRSSIAWIESKYLRFPKMKNNNIKMVNSNLYYDRSFDGNSNFRSSSNSLINHVGGTVTPSLELAYDEMELSILKLPKLSPREKIALASGESIQKLDREGSSGIGVIILDVPASPDDVFNILTKFHKYESMIPTVRSVKIYSNNELSNVAEFCVSKLRLKLNVQHTIAKEQRTIHFCLDKTRPNLVLRQATGYWHIEAPSDRPEGYSRVYFKAEVIASRLLPLSIVDYAAARALIRATNWMQPYFESNNMNTYVVTEPKQ